MGTSAVRNLIGVIILIIFSFVIGINAADNIKSAAMIFAGIIGIIAIVAMGKNTWMCLFLLIPALRTITSFSLPVHLMMIVGILLYWFILVILGHARFTWHKLLGADLLVAIFICYMLTVMYRNPALGSIFSLKFGLESEISTTSYEYEICFISALCYIAYSCIPYDKRYIYKVIKWGVIIKMAVLVITACLNARNSNISLAESQRITMFTAFANCLFVFIYASQPIGKLIFSPKAIAGILLSIFLVLISGFRSRLIILAFPAFFIAIIKKERLFLVMSFCLVLVTLFMINDRNTLNSMPYTVQRALSVIPGMDVNPSIVENGKSSNEWRFQMWKWALDSRTRFIKNYWLGDGCTYNFKDYTRVERAHTRHKIDEQEYNYRTKGWHSGFISIIQELGIVGLILTFVCLVYAFITTMRIGIAFRGSPFLKYYIVSVHYFLSAMVIFYVLPGNTHSFLLYFSDFAILKIFHRIAVEDGYIVPGISRRKKYIPLLISENINEAATAE